MRLSLISRNAAFRPLLALLATTAFPSSIALAQADRNDSGDGAAATYGDIIVTAQRRAERAQSIPMTINSATSEMLQASNVKTAVDIGKIVPGTQLVDNNGSVMPYIRGIGSNLTTVGIEAPNAIYIDGVYQTRLAPIVMRLNSVERIEVLKGPQGTLFGRNSTGGLIQIVTKEPEVGGDTKADLRVGYGNYDLVDASAYISGTLSSAVAADLSVVYSNQMDGWGKIVATGADTFRHNDFAIRSKLVIEPSEDLSFVLTGYYNRGRGSKAELNTVYFGANGRSGIPDGSGFVPFYKNYFNRNGTSGYFDHARQYGGVLKIDKELSFATLRNITAYNNLRDRMSEDVDNTPSDFFYNDNFGFERRFTNELQLLSKDGSNIQWAAGLFYLNQVFGYHPQRYFGPYVGGFLEFDTRGHTKSYAAYAQATAPLTDKLSLTLGGRYSIDDLSAGGSIAVAGPTIIVPFFTADKTYKSFIWKAVLSYQATPDFLLYASQSRGAKAGQFNIIPFDPVPVEPEKMDAFEVGFKSDLLDRRVRFNVAAFYYRLSNLQVQAVSSIGTPINTNAGKSRVYGLEVETQIVPTRNVNLRASASFLDAKYSDFPNAAFNFADPNPPYGLLPPVSMNAAGNYLAQAPKFAFNLGGQWRIPLGESAIVADANYAHQSTVYFSDDNFTRQKGYGRLDGRLTYELADDRTSISLWGSNLTNKRYYTYMVGVTGAIGVIGIPGAPRQYGLELRYRY